jgi:hypothetical protein
MAKKEFIPNTPPTPAAPQDVTWGGQIIIAIIVCICVAFIARTKPDMLNQHVVRGDHRSPPFFGKRKKWYPLRCWPVIFFATAESDL